jgi:hypothetical protein
VARSSSALTAAWSLAPCFVPCCNAAVLFSQHLQRLESLVVGPSVSCFGGTGPWIRWAGVDNVFAVFLNFWCSRLMDGVRFVCLQFCCSGPCGGCYDCNVPRLLMRLATGCFFLLCGLHRTVCCTGVSWRMMPLQYQSAATAANQALSF